MIYNSPNPYNVDSPYNLAVELVPDASGSPAWINPWRRKRWNEDDPLRPEQLAAIEADDEDVIELFGML